MSRTYWFPVKPGIPAAGHVTVRGFWHPGNGHTCSKCNPTTKRREVTR